MYPFAHVSRYPVRRLRVRAFRSKKTTAMLNTRCRDAVIQNEQRLNALLNAVQRFLFIDESGKFGMFLPPYDDDSENCRKQHESPIWMPGQLRYSELLVLVKSRGLAESLSNKFLAAVCPQRPRCGLKT